MARYEPISIFDKRYRRCPDVKSGQGLFMMILLIILSINSFNYAYGVACYGTADYSPQPLRDAPYSKKIAGIRGIQAEISEAKPGDHILLPEGIYKSTLSIEAYGNSSVPIIISGSKNGAIFNSLKIKGKYLIIENFTVVNKYAEDTIGIRIYDASNITVRNVEVMGGAVSGIRVEFNSTDIIIENSMIHDRNGLERFDYNAYLYLFLGVVSCGLAVLLKRNRKKSGGKFGISDFLIIILTIPLLLALNYINPEVYPFNYHPGLDAHGIAIQADTSNITVRNCTIWGNSGDSIQVLNPPREDIDVAHHIYILNNTLYGNRENSIDIKDSEWIFIRDNRCESSKIRPTFDSGVIISVHFSVSHVRIENNDIGRGVIGLVVAHSSGATGYIRTDINSSDYVISSNRFYDINDQGFSPARSVCGIFVRRIVDLTIENNVFEEGIQNTIDLSNEPEGWYKLVNNSQTAEISESNAEILPFYPTYEEYILVSGELLIFFGVFFIYIRFVRNFIVQRKHNDKDLESF